MDQKRWRKVAVASSPTSWLMMLLVGWIFVGAGSALVAQDTQDEDVYLMDLGIIIEPGHVDSAAGADSLPAMDDVGLMVGKEPPGAAYIESTRELRTALDDLSGKINSLEHSLDQDMEGVRLENERLRTLIRKIQSERKESEVSQALESAPDWVEPFPGETAQSPLPDNPGFRHILQAYRAGRLDDLIELSQVIDESILSTKERVHVAYWRADAYFHRGRFDEALQALEEVPATDHELRDDIVVLQGLIYLRQGKAQQARSRFQTILSQYPASEYQRLAELTIKELKHL
ncbi:MAG: tetratricopeptide repeat protein [Fidelibacterota bacterium]|nr:MAG: tetratricopeptide repeat protein [Candidatus Neomarinimicrobiota bacterium]